MSYDLVVVGGGPGGYVAAIRAAQLKMKVALVEKYPSLGGTCLNVGCIPSKALLDSSERYFEAVHRFKEHGISVQGISLDWNQMRKRKDDVVSMTTKGIGLLMKNNKIDVLTGVASFTSPSDLVVATAEGPQKVTAKNVIIATGSKPSSLPSVALDKKRVISSTEALSLPETPKHLIVIGGGVIGLELASVYARLGSKVTVIEYMDSLIPMMDRELGRELARVLKKELKMDLKTSHKVTSVVGGDLSVTVKAQDKNGAEVTFEGDYCLVAVGRRPYTDGLNLAAAGLTIDAKGFIPVDDHLRTQVPHIFAIGDVVRGAMLAHKAEEEGVAAVERLAGQKPHVDYNLIPGVVYTWPEVAAVGPSEEELKAKGRAYKAGKFQFRASGRARAGGDIDGFIKVLADASTDEILAVHMIGPRCADMIAEAVTAMEFKASAEDIGRICHAHPTFSEALKEACLAATDNRAIHA